MYWIAFTWSVFDQFCTLYFCSSHLRKNPFLKCFKCHAVHLHPLVGNPVFFYFFDSCSTFYAKYERKTCKFCKKKKLSTQFVNRFHCQPFRRITAINSRYQVLNLGAFATKTIPRYSNQRLNSTNSACRIKYTVMLSHCSDFALKMPSVAAVFKQNKTFSLDTPSCSS